MDWRLHHIIWLAALCTALFSYWSLQCLFQSLKWFKQIIWVGCGLVHKKRRWKLVVIRILLWVAVTTCCFSMCESHTTSGCYSICKSHVTTGCYSICESHVTTGCYSIYYVKVMWPQAAFSFLKVMWSQVATPGVKAMWPGLTLILTQEQKAFNIFTCTKCSYVMIVQQPWLNYLK